MTEQALKTRFKNWALSVVLFCRSLPPADDFGIIKAQLIRSATSSAANYRAVCRGKSLPDFVNKLKIVEEELDESMFWLELLVGLEASLREPVVPLFKEADELLAITVASIKTIRLQLSR